MSGDGFWDNPAAAQPTIQKATDLREWVTPMEGLQGALASVQELLADPEMASDPEMALMISAEIDKIGQQLELLELKRMLSGEFDTKNCYFTITAGAGGTESCDWVSILARMYGYWMARHEWKVEQLEAMPGEIAGLKSITYRVIGKYAYGYCRAEKGVHRLVRISPFDSNQRRHTSFAAVEVIPEFDDALDIVVNEKDLRVDTFHASGAGGQHVNTTDSAVRITHIPSGVVVTCQNERSQHKNRDSCMKMLRSKLFALEHQKQRDKLAAIAGKKQENAWGSQIRSYILDDRIIKDRRTKIEQRNVDAVLNRGDLDPFVTGFLKMEGSGIEMEYDDE